ncbi:MAG TPA: hypothetical protein VM328_02400 [Fimbriimonadaceae bacterium]|nr:hypothetical protein [Fimbriimonadaceae bacterium]
MGFLPLLANAGTPLMWAGCCLLIFGNLVIGVVEARLLERLLRRPVDDRPLVLANYASMSAGIGMGWALDPLSQRIAADPLRLGLIYIAILWTAAFCLTVLIEWPFASRAASLGSFSRSVLPLLATVNVITYAFLILLVGLLGGVNVFIAFRNSEAAQVTRVEGWVYYCDPKKHAVQRVRLDGSREERVAALPSLEAPGQTRLVFDDPKGVGSVSLFLRVSGSHRLLLQSDWSPRRTATTATAHREANGLLSLGNLTFGPGSTLMFRPDESVAAGFWPAEGLRVRGVAYRLETPFLALTWRSPTVLPDGTTVAQLGDAIVLVNAERGKGARLAAGVGPAVLLDRPERNFEPSEQK